MIECPKCHELNGESMLICFKCGSSITKKKEIKKICRNCGEIYRGDMSLSQCPSCDNYLSIYDPEVQPRRTKGRQHGNTPERWQYIIAFFIPFIGLILGLIYVGQKDERGKGILIFSTVMMVVWVIVSTLIEVLF